MTRLQRTNVGSNHVYRFDCDCGAYRKGDPHKLPGVTTALNALAKPALIDWAARTAAERAVNEWDELAQLPLTERLQRIQWGARDKTRAAALRGTQIHAYGDKLARGEEVDVPEEHIGPVEAYARWLDRWDVETIASETPLCHTQHLYAGTADLWARVGKRDNAVCLLDVKTGKGVYNETGLQLAAYRYSDLMQPEKGVEIATPAVDLVYVAHVLPDDVRMLPVTADETVFRDFLYVLQVHRAMQSWQDWTLIGAGVTPEDREDVAL